ncbi:MAG: DUF421 domain-containing protein [Bacteroidota bacterium]|nr:DUF421 domain-containing protein [Odoribacter sp.]MDP3642932.1 DUF421 domain-containing protein [Bacteroidota bacterium]
MEILKNDYLSIIISSVAVYLFMIFAIRLFGKKELSQLSVIDLVFILLISNSVQNAMVGNNTTLWGGLVAASALFVFNFMMKQAIYHFPSLSKFIQGEAILLVYKGNMKIENMHRTRITHEELMEAVREHGVNSISDVDLAMLEVDGNISILSKDFHQKTIRKRKVHKAITKHQ